MSYEFNLPLKFVDSFDLINFNPRMILFSGVLQYVPNPYDILCNAVSLNPDYICIDRTALGTDSLWRIQDNSSFINVQFPIPTVVFVSPDLFHLWLDIA